jgi:hypothetical protein
MLPVQLITLHYSTGMHGLIFLRALQLTTTAHAHLCA